MKGKVVFEANKAEAQKILNKLSSEYKVISYRKTVLTFTNNDLIFLNE